MDENKGHVFGDDSVCRNCGFDAIVWLHDQMMQRKSNQQMPTCSYKKVESTQSLLLCVL